jgi:flagellar basal-body rod modification protein FlgD
MNVQGFTPAMPAPVQTPSAKAADTTSTSGGSNGIDSSSLQTTFLNLLITELQNQDPTSPVDPTEMVGQMVSLNQLDQLISINQTLEGLAGGTTTPTGGVTTTGVSQNMAKPVATPATSAAPNAASIPANTVVPATAYTGTSSDSGFMNLYGGYGMPTANSQITQRGAK